MGKTWSIQALAEASGVEWHTVRHRLTAAGVEAAMVDGNGPRYAGPEAFPAIFGTGAGHQLREWEVQRKNQLADWELKELQLTRLRRSTVPNPLVSCALEIVTKMLDKVLDELPEEGANHLILDRLYSKMYYYLRAPEAAKLQAEFAPPKKPQ